MGKESSRTYSVVVARGTGSYLSATHLDIDNGLFARESCRVRAEVGDITGSSEQRGKIVSPQERPGSLYPILQFYSRPGGCEEARRLLIFSCR